MFAKIGRKVKILAQALFAVLTAASVFGGFYLMSVFYRVPDMGSVAIPLGLAAIVLGVLISWATALLTYGFGELIDSAAQIRDCLLGVAPAEEAAAPSVFKRLAKALGIARAPQPAAAPQPQEAAPAAGGYQPPQTAPAYGSPRPQADPYQRNAAFDPARQPAASLTGASGWAQVDAQHILCPNCRLVLPALQARRGGCCPQCGMPFHP